MDVQMTPEAQRFFGHFPEQVDYELGGVFGSHEHACRLINLLNHATFADCVTIDRRERQIGNTRMDLAIFLFTRQDAPGEWAALLPIEHIMQKRTRDGMPSFVWRPEPVMREVFAPGCNTKWGERA